MRVVLAAPAWCSRPRAGRAREDDAALQDGRRRPGGGRPASTCRGSTSTTWSARCCSRSTTTRERPVQRHRARARRPTRSCRRRSAARSAGPRSRRCPRFAREGALRRDGVDRHDGRARGAEAAARGGLLVPAAGARRRAPGGGRLTPRVAALLGALTIAFSAILVKASDVAPATSAFFRCFYARARAAGFWRRGSSAPRAQRRLALRRGRALRDRPGRLALLDRRTSAPGWRRCSATSRSSSSA